MSASMSLFKYVAPERLDILKRGLIRFTPASEFNDPFECLSDSRLIENARWQRKIEDCCVAEMLADAEVRRRNAHLDLLQIEAEVRRVHRERYSHRLDQLKVIALQQLSFARLPFRILCLSKVPPDADGAFLMWGHYTSNHSGFVIEFDDQHPWFTEHLPIRGQPHDADDVHYDRRRPSWEIDCEGNASPHRKFVFTKSMHWAYEREYRLIRFAGTPGLEETNSLSLVPIPLESILSITLGINCRPETKAGITSACHHASLRHVRLRQAQIHPDEYLLTLTQLNDHPEADDSRGPATANQT